MLTWPLDWWWGALAMGAVTFGFWLLTGRPLGISGSWSRLVTAREDAKLRAIEAQVAAAPEAFEAAMLAATLEAFGPAAPLSSPGAVAPAAASLEPAVRSPWTAHLVFLLSLGAGGALASVAVRGALSLRSSPGPDFERLFGSAGAAPLVMLLGGVLVGFGTRMCGGCSSGHGLSGVSRLQKGSLVATIAFFGAAVLASLLLRRVLA